MLLFFRGKGSIYLVFEFCAHDLAGLLSNATVRFTLGEIKKVSTFARFSITVGICYKITIVLCTVKF